MLRHLGLRSSKNSGKYSFYINKAQMNKNTPFIPIDHLPDIALSRVAKDFRTESELFKGLTHVPEEFSRRFPPTCPQRTIDSLIKVIGIHARRKKLQRPVTQAAHRWMEPMLFSLKRFPKCAGSRVPSHCPGRRPWLF